jgi:hypothetical protein
VGECIPWRPAILRRSMLNEDAGDRHAWIISGLEVCTGDADFPIKIVERQPQCVWRHVVFTGSDAVLEEFTTLKPSTTHTTQRMGKNISARI